MGVVKKAQTVIEGVTYTTETFPASEAFDLYAEVSAVIPEEVMTLIMLPVSQAVQKKRKGELEDGENIDAAINVSMQDLVVTLETPGIMAKIIKTVLQEAADVPGGISRLMKKVLRRTHGQPLRVAGFEGAGSVVTHFDTHFGADVAGMKEALAVCVWVLRLNLGAASSDVS